MIGVQDGASPCHARIVGDRGRLRRTVEAEMNGTSESILTVGGHHLAAGHTPFVRIADPVLKLPEQPPEAGLAPARTEFCRVQQRLDERPGLEPHREEAEPEAAAERERVLAPGRPPREGRHPEIHVLGDALPSNPLEDEPEGEARLELHDDRRLVASHRDQIAGFDLALDRVPLPFEERLHRRIEFGLAHGRNSATAARSVFLERRPRRCDPLESSRGEIEPPIQLEVVNAFDIQRLADVGNLPVAPSLLRSRGLLGHHHAVPFRQRVGNQNASLPIFSRSTSVRSAPYPSVKTASNRS